ncbi:MAG TPA: DnaJ domain-containing protein [Anaeromyxobacter sp.]|nr:DnaJ domain-containing protein [Anaeromyxobacter sp.]
MSVDRYKGFVFGPADLAEDVDLDVDRRKELLFLDGSLARLTHWEVLGLAWNAPAEAVKAAYLEKVKIFHPDRYPGKRLGSYRARMERVFRRVTEARDGLSDEARRAAYAKQTAPPEEFARLEARKIEDERRVQERRARLSRQNPLLARVGRVAELVKRGKEAMEAGRFGQAANDLALAQGLDPQNAELAGLVADARRRAAAQKAGELFEKGLAAEAMGSWPAALAAYRAALEADPRHTRAASAGTRAALEVGDPGAARELAEAAVRATPQAGAAHEALAMVLEAQGAKKDAKRELERALELDPRLESARERLKKLKWSFLG